MEKKNQMENLFFDPDKPGSIFIGIDRYHHFIPLPGNSLRFIEGGRPEKTDAAFRQFLSDNVDGAKCCTYVPDIEMVRYDLPSMKEVPQPDVHVPLDRYIRQELLPFLQRNCVYPSRQVSLPDAVYCSAYKRNPDCSILKKYFMQEADYMSFLRNQGERQKIYRGETDYRTPLKVVENGYGYLVFSGNGIGKEGFRACLQHIVDRYFDPHHDVGHLAIYEYPYISKDLVPHIDASYRVDRNRRLNNAFDFRRENYADRSKLPDKFINGLSLLYYSPMEATADGFMGLMDKLHVDPELRTQTGVRNRDIYRLLTVMKNGYMNIHEQPFTYFGELLPIAQKIEKITQVRSTSDFNKELFNETSQEIRQAADVILKRDFDVRGHRSLKNMLGDPAVTFTVGGKRLSEPEKYALLSGAALYIPENNTYVTRHLQYCKADFAQDRIQHSSKPFGIKTYMMKDGMLHPLPEEKNAVKKAEIKNRRNNNRLK